MYRKIKLLRERMGLSLQDVADRCHIAKSTLQRYETGITKKIPQSAIAALEEVFGEKIAPENFEEEEKRDISHILERCITRLDNEALMFDGKALDDETRALLIASIKSSLEMAKIIAKPTPEEK